MFFSTDTWKNSGKLVIAIDFGTTQSSVTYSCLLEGAQQSIKRVHLWPGQAARKGDGKVPTVIWYDSNGKPQAYGSEALSDEMKVRANENHWYLAEHFKLHLHPEMMRSDNDIIVPPLPPGTTLSHIMAHWFRYLFRCTKEFFCDREVEGKRLWTRFQPTLEFVICHPNGWDKSQQSYLRQAAIDGGLVIERQARERVHFVTEAEASVHFLIVHGNLKGRLQRNTDFVICDAGGSTVDTTLYSVTDTIPLLRLREKRASSCIQAGAIHVNQLASAFLRRRLSSVFHDEDLEAYLGEALDNFEHEVKRMFSENDHSTIGIKLGGKSLNADSINLQSGFLRASSEEVESFFEPWVKDIICSVKNQMKGHNVQRLILVGGFGDSPYLRNQLRREFKGIELTVANERSAEVVSDGATIWHIQRLVVARAARYTYGIPVQHRYNPSDPIHRQRRPEKRKGGDILNGVWDVLVSKDVVLDDNSELRRPLWTSFSSRQVNLSDTRIDLYALISDDPRNQPYFVFDESGKPIEGFFPVCSIKADMSGMQSKMKSIWSLRGRSWRLHYDVVMLFGGTEFKACIAWKDPSGKEQRGLAAIVPVKLSLGERLPSDSGSVLTSTPS